VRSERMDEIAEKGMQHITNIKMATRREIGLELISEFIKNSI
jgi:hypothetical protein